MIYAKINMLFYVCVEQTTHTFFKTKNVWDNSRRKNTTNIFWPVYFVLIGV